MIGDARKRSKWDAKERSHEIVEISEDESLPDKTGVHHKGRDSHPKPDTSLHHGGSGLEKEQSDGFNKDTKEMQAKPSSERSQPLRTTDERDNNEWNKAVGNQGLNRYADDRRRDDGWARGDGWGTARSRGYSSRVPSDSDAWRQYSRSPSPRGVWNRSRRNRSRSRSRSRNRSRSRSRSRSIGRGRGRSRSPYFADRGSEWRVERGRTSGGPALPCRDFVAGRCRRGSNCRFLHEDGGHRPFEDNYPADPRERYGYQSKEFMDSREPNDYRRGRQSRDRYDDGPWDRSEPRRDYRSTEQCYNFAKGRCLRGASCRFAHDDSSHGGWRDEGRESALDRVGPDSSYGIRSDHRRVNKNPCKFFAEGRCLRGENCPYLHEAASQSQIGESAPDKPLNHSDGRATRGNYSNWGEQSNAMHVTSQMLSRDDRENPISQSIVRNDSRYEYENQHSKDAGKNEYQVIPQEDFGSQVQNKHEAAVSPQPQLLTRVQTTADGMNNEKVSSMDSQNVPATVGDLSMQSGMHSASIIGEQSLGHILQRHDAIPHIPGPSTLPVTTQLQNVASSFPSNSHVQQNNFPVHQNRQEQFVVPQAAANNSTPSMQPVAPHMGHGQHGYSIEPHALPNLPAHNGHNFSVASQVPLNLPTAVHAGQTQAMIDMPRLGQDTGPQSIQNMQEQDFQPMSPNVRNQSLGLSLVPTSSSADIVGVPVSHNAVKSEEVSRVTASLAQYFGNTAFGAGTVGLQSSQPNLNASLMTTSSVVPPAIQPNQWSWTQHQTGIVQPGLSVPSEQQQAPQTFQMPTTVGSSNGNSVLLTHAGAPSGPAATASVVNETVPPENKKGENKDSDPEAHEDGDNKKSKDSKPLKMFKVALADFVKEALKPTWKEGQMSREIHKTIVKKVVDKVTSTVENTPPTKEKIDIYMTYSKEKLNKLVQAYVSKYSKA